MKKSNRKRKRKKKNPLVSLSSETTLALLKGEKKSRLIKEYSPSPEYKKKKLIPDFGTYYQEKLDKDKPCLFMLINDEYEHGSLWQRNKDNEFGSLTTTVEISSQSKDSEYKTIIYSTEQYLATIEFKEEMVSAFQDGLSAIINDINKVIIFVATPNFSASYITKMGEEVLPFLGSDVFVIEGGVNNDDIFDKMNCNDTEMNHLIQIYL